MSSLHFRGWDYAAVRSLPETDWPRLTDAKGEQLKLEEAKTAKDEKVSKILSPGETATNWLAFQNNPSPLGGVPRGTGRVRGHSLSARFPAG